MAARVTVSWLLSTVAETDPQLTPQEWAVDSGEVAWAVPETVAPSVSLAVVGLVSLAVVGWALPNHRVQLVALEAERLATIEKQMVAGSLMISSETLNSMATATATSPLLARRSLRARS